MRNAGINMSTIKKAGYRIVALLSVVLFAGLALVLPNRILDYYDHAVENKEETYSVAMEVYENSYDSFGEKILGMADKEAWGKISFVPVAKESLPTTAFELTAAVNRELEEFFSYCELFSFSEWKERDLKEWKLASLYSEESDNPLNGMLFWQLYYQSDEMELQVILDYEFERICSVVFLTGDVTSFLSPYYQMTEQFEREACNMLEICEDAYYKKSVSERGLNWFIFDFAGGYYGYELFVTDSLSSPYYLIDKENVVVSASDGEVKTEEKAGKGEIWESYGISQQNILLQCDLRFEKNRGIVVFGIWNLFEMMHF